MNPIDYAQLEALIAQSSVQGNTVSVRFRCPESGVEVESAAPLKKLDDMQSQAARSVKKNLFAGIRRSATRAVSDTLGKGVAGKIAKDLTTTGLRQAEKDRAFGQREIQAALVTAFEKVQARFRWDEAAEAWRGAEDSATIKAS